MIAPGELVEIRLGDSQIPSFMGQNNRREDAFQSWVVMRGRDAIYCLQCLQKREEMSDMVPLRHLSVMAGLLTGQLATREDCEGWGDDEGLIPVVTAVIYLGTQDWAGPVSFSQCLATRKSSVLRGMPDYEIGLLLPRNVRKEELFRFQSDLGAMLWLLGHADDSAELLETLEQDRYYRNMPAEIYPVIAGAFEGEPMLPFVQNQKGDFDMSMALQKLCKKAVEEDRRSRRSMDMELRDRYEQLLKEKKELTSQFKEMRRERNQFQKSLEAAKQKTAEVRAEEKAKLKATIDERNRTLAKALFQDGLPLERVKELTGVHTSTLKVMQREADRTGRQDAVPGEASYPHYGEEIPMVAEENVLYAG